METWSDQQWLNKEWRCNGIHCSMRFHHWRPATECLFFMLRLFCSSHLRQTDHEQDCNEMHEEVWSAMRVSERSIIYLRKGEMIERISVEVTACRSPPTTAKYAQCFVQTHARAQILRMGHGHCSAFFFFCINNTFVKYFWWKCPLGEVEDAPAQCFLGGCSRFLMAYV